MSVEFAERRGRMYFGSSFCRDTRFFSLRKNGDVGGSHNDDDKRRKCSAKHLACVCARVAVVMYCVIKLKVQFAVRDQNHKRPVMFVFRRVQIGDNSPDPERRWSCRRRWGMEWDSYDNSDTGSVTNVVCHSFWLVASHQWPSHELWILLESLTNHVSG